MEGFYLMENHAKDRWPRKGYGAGTRTHDAQRGTAGKRDPEDQQVTRLPLEQREVTAILIRTVNPLVTPGLRNDQ